MGLKQKGMVKVVAAATSLSLTPRSGEAIRVRRIEVAGPTATEYLTVKIAAKTVGYFNVADQYEDVAVVMNHLVPVGSEGIEENIFETLLKNGTPLVYPVAEGEELLLEITTAPTNILVLYDIYDAADVSNEEPNGSKSKSLMYIAYLRNSASIAAIGDLELDQLANPGEFTGFPTTDVPANSFIELLAPLARPVTTSKGTGSVPDEGLRTDRLKFFNRQTVIGDLDRNGYPYESRADNYNSAGTTLTTHRQVHNMFPPISTHKDKVNFYEEPMVFDEGEELDVIAVLVSDEGTPATIPAGEILVGLILRHTFK